MPPNKSEYQPLQPNDSYLDNKETKSEGDGYPVIRGSRIRSRWYLVLLVFTMMLVISNIVQATWGRSWKPARQPRVSTTGLEQAYIQPQRMFNPTPYVSEDSVEREAAWAGIYPGHGLVAVSEEFVRHRELPDTMASPLDRSKRIYALEAYHAIHCLKRIRIDYEGLPQSPHWTKEHNIHCFDAIRQHIMCHADDTLLYTWGNGSVGTNQARTCRDWNSLKEWAWEHTALYDSDPPKGLSRWGRDNGGEDGLLMDGMYG